MEDDEPGRGSSKLAFGDASHSGLLHYAMSCGKDEPMTDLYTCPDLCRCNLNGTDEERRFLGGIFHRISIPEAEYALSKKSADDLMKDVEVTVIKALLLARGACLHHGFIETDLQEKLAALEKREVNLKTANKELPK